MFFFNVYFKMLLMVDVGLYIQVSVVMMEGEFVYQFFLIKDLFGNNLVVGVQL